MLLVVHYHCVASQRRDEEKGKHFACVFNAIFAYDKQSKQNAHPREQIAATIAFLPI